MFQVHLQEDNKHTCYLGDKVRNPNVTGVCPRQTPRSALRGTARSNRA